MVFHYEIGRNESFVHSLRMTISLVHETLAFTHAHNNLQVVTPLMVIESTIDVQAFYTHTYILPVCNHRASFSMAYVSVCIRILHLYTLYFILFSFNEFYFANHLAWMLYLTFHAFWIKIITYVFALDRFGTLCAIENSDTWIV